MTQQEATDLCDPRIIGKTFLQISTNIKFEVRDFSIQILNNGTFNPMAVISYKNEHIKYMMDLNDVLNTNICQPL